jgi:hypothetical protein
MRLTEDQLKRLESDALAQCVPLGTPVRVMPGELMELLRVYRESQETTE